ncbi:MAG: type II secretion system F family protein [Deltaproteobacteria bacterium]|nr:type II secretion system F family protein [Deltaproteobacteria bacterium]
MTCPACGFEWDGGTECPRCGIVFSKWRARRHSDGAERAPDNGAVAAKSLTDERGHGARATIRSANAAVSDGVLLWFYKQMAALLDAGVSMQEALGITGGAAAPRVVRRAVAQMRTEITSGATFGVAIDAARFVDREAVVLLRAAEIIGNLPSTFAELATDVEKRTAFRRTVVMGLAYPAILAVLSIFALPLKVLVFEGPARYFAETLPVFGGFVGAVFFLWSLFPRVLGWIGVPGGVRDAVCLIPFLGRPWRALRVARFSRSLGRFLDAGVEIGEALESAAASTGQRRFLRAVDGASQRIAAGATLAEALQATGLFTADFHLAVDGAERSGKLAPTLIGVAEAIEDSALHQVRLSILVGTTIAAVLVMAFIGYRLFTEMQGTVKGVTGAIDSVLREAGDIQRGVDKSFEQLDKLLDQ